MFTQTVLRMTQREVAGSPGTKELRLWGCVSASIQTRGSYLWQGGPPQYWGVASWGEVRETHTQYWNTESCWAATAPGLLWEVPTGRNMPIATAPLQPGPPHASRWAQPAARSEAQPARGSWGPRHRPQPSPRVGNWNIYFYIRRYASFKFQVPLV